MKKRILVVEDEDKLRRILELQLLDSGYDVVKAATAEEALPLIDRSDLILTDLKLPGMTGIEMLQLVRRQDSHVPVIVMTAFGTVENAVDAMKAGAAEFPLLVPISALASPSSRLWPTVILTIALIGFAWLLFVQLLSLPLSLLTW